MAFVSFIEVKRPGWKPDKRWPEGHQPTAYA
jgi:hypothetical protein